MYIHTSCTAPVYLKTSQEVKSWHSHNAIFHWDFQKYSFRIICYHWLSVSGISKIMHWQIVISHDRILYHCSAVDFVNPEHKCSGCKREDVMSVSYCITCDKKLCPHHQQVFTDTHPHCIFWPKLPELLAQNHNLLSSTGYAWKFIYNTLCGMIFIIYNNTSNGQMWWFWNTEFLCWCIIDVTTIRLYTQSDCLSESWSELLSTSLTILTY